MFVCLCSPEPSEPSTTNQVAKFAVDRINFSSALTSLVGRSLEDAVDVSRCLVRGSRIVVVHRREMAHCYCCCCLASNGSFFSLQLLEFLLMPWASLACNLRALWYLGVLADLEAAAAPASTRSAPTGWSPLATGSLADASITWVVHTPLSCYCPSLPVCLGVCVFTRLNISVHLCSMSRPWSNVDYCIPFQGYACLFSAVKLPIRNMRNRYFCAPVLVVMAFLGVSESMLLWFRRASRPFSR